MFEKAILEDAWIVTPDPSSDERGYFARTYCRKEFEAHGIGLNVVQCNVSFNVAEGTLRGMHYQKEPAAEPKLVECVHGAIYDVIVDLRKESPTYLQSFAIELTGRNRKKLFVPRNFAHGFLTLEANTEVSYMMGEYYNPEFATGLRYDDPALNIHWPSSINVVSEKDRSWPLL